MTWSALNSFVPIGPVPRTVGVLRHTMGARVSVDSLQIL